MSCGMLGEYPKSLFVSSPCTQRFFPRILQIRLNTFHLDIPLLPPPPPRHTKNYTFYCYTLFGDDFVYRK